MIESKYKKTKRKIIKIDEESCTGCGKCVISCAEGALEIVNGKAKVISEVFCDGLGACIGECPEGALTIEEREAYEFSEEAVEEYLENFKNTGKDGRFENKTKKSKENHTLSCNCPSSKPIVYDTPWEEHEDAGEFPSALRQWPTKLTLVNPKAPYFNQEELLIISDCSPIAHGDFHRKIMKGRPLVTICPMLNLGEMELEKLEAILQENPIKHVELILMEVPCCQKLKLFLDPIITKIGRQITVEEKIISREGKIIRQEVYS